MMNMEGRVGTRWALYLLGWALWGIAKKKNTGGNQEAGGAPWRDFLFFLDGLAFFMSIAASPTIISVPKKRATPI